MIETAIIPTWGYRPDGSADIFDLRPGETLPEGWHPSPTIITDPALATAEGLSASIAPAAETPRPPPAPRAAPAGDARAAKVSHSSQASSQAESLNAENAGLVAEIAELRQALDASRAAHADALAHIEVLATQLAESLALVALPKTKPESDGSTGAKPPPADAPTVRTLDKARDAVRALLGDDLTDREIARRVNVSPSTVAAVRRAAGS